MNNEREIEQLRAELAQLRRRAAITNQRCGYCGYQYSAGTKAVNFVVMREHIETCPEHPLAKALSELAQAQAELAVAQKAAEWLWGFWDGNTLVAKPGYEDDIREAWGKLLVAVDSADDALLERLATLDAAEAALAGCGIGGIYCPNIFNGLPDAITQMAEHIRKLLGQLSEAEIAAHVHGKAADKLAQALDAERALRREAKEQLADARRVARLWFRRACEPMVEVEITGKEMVEALQAERQLRREAERRCEAMSEMARDRGTRLRIAEQDIVEMKVALNKALDATKTPGAWPEGRIMTITERIFWLNSKLQFTEAELSNGHRALSEFQVNSVYEDGEANIITRIYWLNQRAERAEALAALVTPELAALLERLVICTKSSSFFGDFYALQQRDRDLKAAHALATKIREALDDKM